MNDADHYLSAALPEPVRVLGQVLHPFSLGHYKRLVRIGNWFVLDPKERTAEPDLSDLLMGVWTCAQTWEESHAKLHDPEAFQKEIEEWGKRLKPEHFEQAFVLFGEYVVDGSTWPELGEPKHHSRMPGSPFIQRVQITLQAKVGLTRSEALNHPLGEALCDYFCYWEMQDAVDVLGREEARLVDVHVRIEQIKEERGCTLEEAIDAALEEQRNPGPRKDPCPST